MHVKTGDKVQVISGKYKGMTGKVLKAMPKDNRVIVEGVNIQTKHKKAQGANQPGGLVKREGPIDASNVLLYDSEAKCGVRTRVEERNGKKVRVSAKTGKVLD